MAKKKDNTAEIGFEEQIWSAADKLRGNIDASEYKNVVLGLIFLKYISDKFDQKYQELVEEGEGFEEDRDEYASENIFFVPESARWKTIAAAAHTPEIGKAIDEAMRQIEAENNKLKGILPKNFARQELDKRRLGEVVDLFTNVKMAEKGDSRDILGRTYEYCLAKFAEAEGKNAGEFYTPACVVKTLVEVIEPYHGRVYDPCCGSGGMFVQSADFVKRHQGNINDISVYGQESNPTTWKMATMNLAIRGIDADLGDYNADTFFEDLHKTEKFDFILANPPFNLKDWGGKKLENDVRWQYGTPPEGNANFAWVQHDPPSQPFRPHGHGSGERRVVQPDEQRGRDPRQDRGCRSGRGHHRNAGQAFLQHRYTCELVDHHQEQEAVRQDVVHRRARYGNHGVPQAPRVYR